MGTGINAVSQVRQVILFLSIIISLFNNVASAQKMPQNFSFRFEFGFEEEGATIYDSGKNLLTIQNGGTIVSYILVLNEFDRQAIFNAMQKIGFATFPEKYSYQFPKDEETDLITPCQHYFLTAKLNKILKTIEWDNCIKSKARDEKHASLMALDDFIENIIFTKIPLNDNQIPQVRVSPK